MPAAECDAGCDGGGGGDDRRGGPAGRDHPAQQVEAQRVVADGDGHGGTGTGREGQRLVVVTEHRHVPRRAARLAGDGHDPAPQADDDVVHDSGVATGTEDEPVTHACVTPSAMGTPYRWPHGEPAVTRRVRGSRSATR